MTNYIKKAAELLEQPAANIKKLQNHFTSIIGRAKAEFVKLAAWLSIAGGV